MVSPALSGAIERLLRSIPRHPDVIAVGEALQAERRIKPTDVVATPPKPVAAAECPDCADRREKKAASMRRYRSKA